MKYRHHFRKAVRYILFLFVVVAYDSVSAQDVIITRDSKRIDASVQEISDTEVRYKRQDNPNGPVFVIKTSEISSIMFANGEVQSFENVQANASSQVNQQQESVNYGSGVSVVSKGRIVQYIPGTPMEYKDLKPYYGGVEMEKDAYKSFLSLTCPTAYAKYQESITLDMIGDIFLGSGSFLMGWGLADLLLAENIEEENTAGTLLLVSLAVGILSIPFYVGSVQSEKKSVEIFNQQCGYCQHGTTVATLSLKVSPMGAGLALNF